MKNIRIANTWLILTVAVTLAAWMTSVPARADADDQDQAKIRRGLQAAPVPLDLSGKNANLVGLGSYIVNVQSGCNDCHSQGPATQFVPGGNPYFGQHPAKTNAAAYLGGGRSFGPLVPGSAEIVSRNLTPNGKRQTLGGDSFEAFLTTMRTGADPDKLHPACSQGLNTACVPAPFDGALLQIMPWPVYQQLTEHDLRAVYEFLGAIPCVEDKPAGPTSRCR